jgi:hypothetical protein
MPPSREHQRSPDVGEPRWPMALAVVAAGALHATLPRQLRVVDVPWLIPAFILALLGALTIADPGRIDRQSSWLRAMTDVLIAFITVVNGWAAVKLVAGILRTTQFDNATVLLASGAALWLTNVIAFALWYWDLDGGGAAARASRSGPRPAFVFPEMNDQESVRAGWYPKFIDYLHLSFTAATAFSPTDVSAIRSWAKLLMMAEEAISLVVALLVVARAVNILK